MNELQTLDQSHVLNMMDSNVFESALRVADLYASSTLVPAHYQKNPANVFIALQLAHRLGADPFSIMQATHIIQGKPGMEAKLVIALVNRSGVFEGPVQWRLEGEGDARRCTAFAKHRRTGEVCEATVTWRMALDEGWATKAGSKWKTMPDLMFRYRSAAFLARLYCPEVLMGMHTADELEDITDRVERVKVDAVVTTPATETPNTAALLADDPPLTDQERSGWWRAAKATALGDEAAIKTAVKAVRGVDSTDGMTMGQSKAVIGWLEAEFRQQ